MRILRLPANLASYSNPYGTTMGVFTAPTTIPMINACGRVVTDVKVPSLLLRYSEAYGWRINNYSLNGKDLRIGALAYANIHADGSVCWGGAMSGVGIVNIKSPLKAWVSFWSTPFNTDLVNGTRVGDLEATIRQETSTARRRVDRDPIFGCTPDNIDLTAVGAMHPDDFLRELTSVEERLQRLTGNGSLWEGEVWQARDLLSSVMDIVSQGEVNKTKVTISGLLAVEQRMATLPSIIERATNCKCFMCRYAMELAVAANEAEQLAVEFLASKSSDPARVRAHNMAPSFVEGSQGIIGRLAVAYNIVVALAGPNGGGGDNYATRLRASSALVKAYYSEVVPYGTPAVEAPLPAGCIPCPCPADAIVLDGEQVGFGVIRGDKIFYQMSGTTDVKEAPCE